jgi:hypothetical protein
MKHLLFPFSRLFDRLNLKQKWWHRLAVVVFFVGFIALAVFIGLFTWAELPSSLSEYDRHQALTESFPQLEPPEDSTLGITFDFVQVTPLKNATVSTTKSGDVDSNKYPAHTALDCYDANGQLLVDDAAAFDGVITGCAPGQTAKPKSERINVPQSRLRYVEHAESCQKKVTAQYAKGDAELYRSKMKNCLTPDPLGYEEATADAEAPQDLFHGFPTKAAFKGNMETSPRGNKVSIPMVGIVAFPIGMSEKEISPLCASLYARASSAERIAKATTITYAVFALLVVFYLPQIAYRLFLYVAFGGNR